MINIFWRFAAQHNDFVFKLNIQKLSALHAKYFSPGFCFCKKKHFLRVFSIFFQILILFLSVG